MSKRIYVILVTSGIAYKEGSEETTVSQVGYENEEDAIAFIKSRCDASACSDWHGFRDPDAATGRWYDYQIKEIQIQ